MNDSDHPMTPEEFAQLSGAMPDAPHNPTPAYGGYMDNGGFAWTTQQDDFPFSAESSDAKDRKCVNCKTTDALNFGQGSSYAESRECMWCWAGQPPESSGGLCQWCFDGVMMDAGEKDGWRHWVCSRTDCESH